MSRVLVIIAIVGVAATTIAAGRVVLCPLPDSGAAHASAPEAGMIAVPGSRADRVRLLYAKNGGMALVREISVPGKVRTISLSADGRDVFVSTDDNAYTVSTRTGRIEAELVVATEAGAPPPSPRLN
jgi:hypothetical protein